MKTTGVPAEQIAATLVVPGGTEKPATAPGPIGIDPAVAPLGSVAITVELPKLM